MTPDAELLAGVLILCTLLLCAVLFRCTAALREYAERLGERIQFHGHDVARVSTTIAHTFEFWKQYDALKDRVKAKATPLRGTKDEAEAWEAARKADGQRTERF